MLEKEMRQIYTAAILLVGIAALVISMSGCASKKVLVDDDSCSARFTIEDKNLRHCNKVSL